MIVLDTNVISEPWKAVPEANVVAWLDLQLAESLYLTAITVAELRFGIAVLPHGRRREVLEDRLERDVLPSFRGRVLAFDLDISRIYASLMAKARANGRAIAREDGYIAAIAAAHGFMVATRDTSPFEAAGITVIDPWQRSSSAAGIADRKPT